MTETPAPVETPARQAVRRRAEFVSAFVEHAGAVPASERATVSLSTLLTVTAMVSALTIVAGVFWGLIDPPKKKQPAAARQYVAVAGWGCISSTTQGFDVAGRSDRWRTVAAGGWAADGCRGQFQTLPMSGTAKDDPGQYVQWWFRPSTGAQCRVDLYLPRGASPADTGADAAHYAVTDGRGGAAYAEFVVDQSRHAGQWHPVGAFPVRNGEFVVRLTNRGVPPQTGYRLAVSAMRVSCGA